MSAPRMWPTNGYAADHVTQIDVVTPDARLWHVTAETDPDLFWALRGGRDDFGVVTGMRIGLVPFTRLYGGGLFFPAESAAEVLAAFAEWTRTLPEELTASVGGWSLFACTRRWSHGRRAVAY